MLAAVINTHPRAFFSFLPYSNGKTVEVGFLPSTSQSQNATTYIPSMETAGPTDSLLNCSAMIIVGLYFQDSALFKQLY